MQRWDRWKFSDFFMNQIIVCVHTFKKFRIILARQELLVSCIYCEILNWQSPLLYLIGIYWCFCWLVNQMNPEIAGIRKYNKHSHETPHKYNDAGWKWRM
jgi:hypothetical protein